MGCRLKCIIISRSICRYNYENISLVNKLIFIYLVENVISTSTIKYNFLGIFFGIRGCKGAGRKDRLRGK